jgi:hypothetical protein
MRRSAETPLRRQGVEIVSRLSKWNVNFPEGFQALKQYSERRLGADLSGNAGGDPVAAAKGGTRQFRIGSGEGPLRHVQLDASGAVPWCRAAGRETPVSSYEKRATWTETLLASRALFLSLTQSAEEWTQGRHRIWASLAESLQRR